MRKNPSQRKKAKEEFLDLMLNPVATPSRRKAIETIMKKKNISYEDAKKYQARRIVEQKNNLNKYELGNEIQNTRSSKRDLTK